MIELMVVIAILGIIASVAIPSFIKYLRRSKTTEASLNVRKMYDASVMYFATEHASATGGIVPKMFPVDEGPTPSTGGATHVCCIAGSGGKCTPDPTLWQTPTWNALHFSVDDPFYFRYQYSSQGTDHSALFHARAEGDLDCDTDYSNYERIGSVDASFNIVGTAGMYISKDIE